MLSCPVRATGPERVTWGTGSLILAADLLPGVLVVATRKKKADREYEARRAALQGLFARRGLRLTRQRSAIYDTLSELTSHPTADDLYRMVSRAHQGISLATVYNTLEAFCRCGLAKKLPTEGASSRYEAAMHNHLHLRDSRTGRVLDVPDDLSEAILKQLPRNAMRTLQKRMRFNVRQIKIEFVGESK